MTKPPITPQEAIELKEVNKKYKKAIGRLHTELDIMRKRLDAARHQIISLQADNKTNQREIERLKQENDSLKKELQRLIESDQLIKRAARLGIQADEVLKRSDEVVALANALIAGVQEYAKAVQDFTDLTKGKELSHG